MITTTRDQLIQLIRSVPPPRLDATALQGRSPGPPGTKLCGGRYVLAQALGIGSFGVITGAMDTRSGQQVALKEFFPVGCRRNPHHGGPEAPDDWPAEELPVLREQFKAEYRALERFERPGIVKVYDLIEEDGGLYLTMELLEGATLDQLLDTYHRLSEPIALYIIRRLSKTLETIHFSGLIHGDIKPENLFLTLTANVILLDFGAVHHYLSRGHNEPRFLTPGYAPPEQYQTKSPPSPASDLYAVGATLYELLTGQAPPEATERLSGARLASPNRLGIDVSAQTVNAMARTLALAHDKRPSTAGDFLRELPAASGEEEPLPPTLLLALTPWVGHQAPVRRLKLTPDGKFLASADRRGELRLWSLPEERCLGVMELKLEIHDLAVHPDGQQIAVALDGGRVELLDLQTGKLLRTIREGLPNVTTLAFSTQDETIICGLATGNLEFYPLKGADLSITLSAHTMTISSIDINPSGRLLALGSHDRSASVWDLKSQRRLRHFTCFQRPIQAAKFCSRGRFLAVGGGDMMLQVFDVRQGDLFRTLKGHEALVWEALALDDYELALTCSSDRSIRLWDTRSFRELTRIQEAQGWLQALAYHDPSRTIFAAGIDGQIYRYYLTSNALAR